MFDTAARRRRITASLDRLSADALLVTNETNVRYLTGFTGDSSYLLLSAESEVILSDGRYETQLREECPDLASLIRPPSQRMEEWVQAAVGAAGHRRVAMESAHVSVAELRFWEQHCPEVHWLETAGLVEALRMIKDEREIELIRHAVQIAETAWQAVLETLPEGLTEREVAYRIESELRQRGAEGCSFPPIVAADHAAALPHYRPSEAGVGDADVLLIDWGANFQGYASDLTRTFHRPTVGDDFRRAYDTVLAAQAAAIEVMAPGVPTADVDAAARRVFAAAGMADAFLHSLGHGIGLEIHEGPRLSGSSDQVLAAGMIVTVEPGAYFADHFGIRIEDDVLVTGGGVEILSRLPKGLADCQLIR